MDLKRVVVTGLGTVNPIGNSIPEFWENAIAGVSGAGLITNFDTNAIQTKVKIGCQVKNFDISQYMDRKEARKLDKYSHFAVASAVQAINDSGLDLEKEDLNRIGVILGFGMGGVDSFEEGVDTIHEQKKLGQELKVTPFFRTPHPGVHCIRTDIHHVQAQRTQLRHIIGLCVKYTCHH